MDCLGSSEHTGIPLSVHVAEPGDSRMPAVIDPPFQYFYDDRNYLKNVDGQEPCTVMETKAVATLFGQGFHIHVDMCLRGLHCVWLP